MEENAIGGVLIEWRTEVKYTNVLTAYLKNSVTRFVEPFRVIA